MYDILCGSNFKFSLVATTIIFWNSPWHPPTYLQDPIYLCKEWRCPYFPKNKFGHSLTLIISFLELCGSTMCTLVRCSPLFRILMALFVLNWQWKETFIYLKKKRKRNNNKNQVTNRLLEPFQDVIYLASHGCHMLMGLHSTYKIFKNQQNGGVQQPFSKTRGYYYKF